jgi:molecular chaperone GrpE
MASWFKQSKRRDADAPDDQAESTIEVKAQVIADAIRSGATDEAAMSLSESDSRLGADGVITGGEFEPDDPPAAGDPGAAGVTAELLNQALAERRSLVQLCVYALDRARSSGVAERIEEGLAAVGVSALRPDGARFDPADHEAGGTVVTDDGSLDGTVAETEVVGFSDRGELLRAPIVTVYTARTQQ